MTFGIFQYVLFLGGPNLETAFYHDTFTFTPADLGISRYEQSWSRVTQLHLERVKDMYSYDSSPEAGMPSLPFEDNPIRKSTDEPWWIVD